MGGRGRAKPLITGAADGDAKKCAGWAVVGVHPAIGGGRLSPRFGSRGCWIQAQGAGQTACPVLEFRMHTGIVATACAYGCRAVGQLRLGMF